MENTLKLNKVLIDDKNNINIKIMEKLQELQLENKLLTEYLEQKETDMQYAFEAFQASYKLVIKKGKKNLKIYVVKKI